MRWIGITMFFMVFAGPFLALATHANGGSTVRLVVMVPGHDPFPALATAGGRMIGPERAVLGFFAHAEDPDRFDAAMKSAGALFVLDGQVLANICGVTL